MFTDTINKCAANAARIARLSANNPLGFWVSSAMAGAYVGLGIWLYPAYLMVFALLMLILSESLNRTIDRERKRRKIS